MKGLREKMRTKRAAQKWLKAAPEAESAVKARRRLSVKKEMRKRRIKRMCVRWLVR